MNRITLPQAIFAFIGVCWIFSLLIQCFSQ